MTKVMTIVGTRPEIIKMSRVISQFDKFVKHILIHTGQNYDDNLSDIFFKGLNIRPPDVYLNIENKNFANFIGQLIIKIDEQFEQQKPDALLIYGDTNSCLSAIVAKRRKIPIFHMEAGNRAFDQRVPEEINRKIIDHISDINFVLSEHARHNLISEGIRHNRIIKTGSHLKEVINFHKKQIEDSSILRKLGLKHGKYFLVSIHREENVDNDTNLLNLLKSLELVYNKYNLPIIVSTHPRTKNKIMSLLFDYDKNNIRFLDPFGYIDYIKLQTNSYCVISDSGTITEEASLLRFPAITVRESHERPEGVDGGVLIMSPMEPNSIVEAINIVTSQHLIMGESGQRVSDYEEELVSVKILRAVISNIEVINKMVWYKKQ